MTTQRDSDEPATRPRQSNVEREVIYVTPSGLAPVLDDDRISLRELWQRLWRGRLTIIAITALFAVGSVAYALLATEVYRAEVLVTPAEDKTMPILGGQLGGLAALAGVNVGTGSEAEPLAVLWSRDFARQFIEDYGLLTVFFEYDWDAENEAWLVDDPADAPDIRDAVKYFHEKVLKVSEERTTGLVTIVVEWTDPEVAATWANVLVKRLNDRLRERALQEAETNVAYLSQEMAKSSLVAMQQSIGQLLQTEMQKLMLARGNDEFAFKVIDPATAPKQRIRPKRSMIAIIGTLLGGLVGAFVVLVTQSARPSTRD